MLVHCPACAGHRPDAGPDGFKRSDQLFKGEITVSEKDTVLLQMKGIDITFPGVHALINVDFDLRHGEIHALVGENGAGKSTLIKDLTGVEKNDAGEIYLNGTQIHPRSTMHAQQLGISTVYQEVNLCPNLSVAENIFVGREPMKFGKIDWKSINEGAANALAKLNIRLDVTRRLDEYSVAIQQMVAIARAVDVDAKVLILDEPTSSLDVQEVRNLFKIMRSLKAQGLGIIFITHFLEQIFEITDRITVLRNGNRVGNFETAGITRLQLVSTMIGKEFEGLNRSLRSETSAGETKGRSFTKHPNIAPIAR
jgi:simple sugar transport system ATP-binding protein